MQFHLKVRTIFGKTVNEVGKVTADLAGPPGAFVVKFGDVAVSFDALYSVLQITNEKRD
jgi:hypothetical protein